MAYTVPIKTLATIRENFRKYGKINAKDLREKEDQKVRWSSTALYGLKSFVSVAENSKLIYEL